MSGDRLSTQKVDWYAGAPGCQYSDDLNIADDIITLAREVRDARRAALYEYLQCCEGEIVDAGGYCAGPMDVRAGIVRLAAELRAYRKLMADLNDALHSSPSYEDAVADARSLIQGAEGHA